MWIQNPTSERKRAQRASVQASPRSLEHVCVCVCVRVGVVACCVFMCVCVSSRTPTDRLQSALCTVPKGIKSVSVRQWHHQATSRSSCTAPPSPQHRVVLLLLMCRGLCRCSWQKQRSRLRKPSVSVATAAVLAHILCACAKQQPCQVLSNRLCKCRGKARPGCECSSGWSAHAKQLSHRPCSFRGLGAKEAKLSVGHARRGPISAAWLLGLCPAACTTCSSCSSGLRCAAGVHFGRGRARGGGGGGGWLARPSGPWLPAMCFTACASFQPSCGDCCSGTQLGYTLSVMPHTVCNAARCL